MTDVSRLITGCNPNSTPERSAKGEPPYSARPGRTQSQPRGTVPKMPAELAMLRAYSRPRIASLKRTSWRRVSELFCSSARARCVIKRISNGAGCSLRMRSRAVPNSLGRKPSRFMPVSIFIHSRKRCGLVLSSSSSICSMSWTTRSKPWRAASTGAREQTPLPTGRSAG